MSLFLFCQQIRAANLSGDCWFSKETFGRFKFGWKGHQQVSRYFGSGAFTSTVHVQCIKYDLQGVNLYQNCFWYELLVVMFLVTPEGRLFTNFYFYLFHFTTHVTKTKCEWKKKRLQESCEEPEFLIRLWYCEENLHACLYLGLKG